MNLFEIIGTVCALFKVVEKMDKSNVKTLVYGLVLIVAGWRLPDLVQAVRWW